MHNATNGMSQDDSGWVIDQQLEDKNIIERKRRMTGVGAEQLEYDKWCWDSWLNTPGIWQVLLQGCWLFSEWLVWPHVNDTQWSTESFPSVAMLHPHPFRPKLNLTLAESGSLAKLISSLLDSSFVSEKLHEHLYLHTMPFTNFIHVSLNRQICTKLALYQAHKIYLLVLTSGPYAK